MSSTPLDRNIPSRGADVAIASRPIHVLHVFGTLMPGGAERQALNIFRFGDRSRFRHSVINYYPEPGDLEQTYRDAGCELHVFQKRAHLPPGFFLKLRRMIRGIRPDVVHTWLFSANFWGRAAAIAARVPGIVASTRTNLQYRHGIERQIDKILSRRTAFRIVNSDGIRQTLLGYGVIPDAKIRVIPNGVDADRLRPSADRATLRRKFGWSADAPVLLAVGRLVWEKDYPTLFSVATKLREKHGGLRIFVSGWGPLESELRGAIAARGLSDTIELLGRREDVNDLYAAADLFLSTSVREGFSNSLLEAMWTGLPVVVTRVHGAVEVVRSEETGLMLEPGDVGGITAAVDRMLTDRALARRLAEAGRREVQSRFSVQAMVAGHEAAYTEAARGVR